MVFGAKLEHCVHPMAKDNQQMSTIVHQLKGISHKKRMRLWIVGFIEWSYFLGLIVLERDLSRTQNSITRTHVCVVPRNLDAMG